MKKILKILFICTAFCTMLSACSVAAKNTAAVSPNTAAGNETRQNTLTEARSEKKKNVLNPEEKEASVTNSSGLAGYISDADGNIIEYVPEITSEAQKENTSNLTVSNTDIILESLVGTLSAVPSEEFGIRMDTLENGMDVIISNISNTVFLAAEEGTEVYALEEGIVTEIGWEAAFGYFVSVENTDGEIIKYTHLSNESEIRLENGDKIVKDQAIGHAGITGLTSKSGVGYVMYK